MKVEKGKYSCSYFKLWSGKIFATTGKYDEESGEFTSTGDMFKTYNKDEAYDLAYGIEYDDLETLCSELVNHALKRISGAHDVKNVIVKETTFPGGEYIISWVAVMDDSDNDYLYEMMVCLRYIMTYELKNNNDFIVACNKVIEE